MSAARGDARIQQAFANAKAGGGRAFIPFITAGDPDLGSTVAITQGLVAGGADVIEWGIPYSDPLADGITVQMASQRALQAGTTSRKVLGAARALREAGCGVPLVLLVYANIMWRYGWEQFVHDAAEAGVDGVIVPDLPVEEGAALADLCRSTGLARIPLVAPTSNAARIRRVVAGGSGFVYCVSVTGVTGARGEMARGLQRYMERVRQESPLPLAIGFGISTPEQARQAAPLGDGVIVGSALIQELEQAHSVEERQSRAENFARRFKGALAEAGSAAV